ncbi:hypothetical protein [Cytobacillus kochii]|uniref:hypothetical protein n=1 Tax=Cytobacillus kochii TaxID=859143 RepID=UPI00247FDE27|nr:hypothetical protein [Cytobacillus kochii]
MQEKIGNIENKIGYNLPDNHLYQISTCFLLQSKCKVKHGEKGRALFIFKWITEITRERHSCQAISK